MSLIDVDMDAALDQALERYVEDIRTQLRDAKVRYLTVAREKGQVVVKFADAAARDAGEKVIAKEFRDLKMQASERGRRAFLVTLALTAGPAEADPGLRAPAEHHDPAQPGQRPGRGRAQHRPPGRPAHRGAVAGRPGPGPPEGDPRRHRHPGIPAGGHRAQRRRCRGRAGAGRQPALSRPRRQAGAAQAPGHRHRRPDHRRLLRLRRQSGTPDGLRQSGRPGRPAHARYDHRERGQAHGRGLHREPHHHQAGGRQAGEDAPRRWRR